MVKELKVLPRMEPSDTRQLECSKVLPSTHQENNVTMPIILRLLLLELSQ
jgi:hypothetical protein